MTKIGDDLEHHPKEAQRLIGLDYDQWQQLLKNIEALNAENQAKIESEYLELLKRDLD